MIEAAFLTAQPGGGAQVWHVQQPEEAVLVTITGERLPPTPRFEAAVVRGLSRAGFLVEMHGVPLLRDGRSWIRLDTAPSARYNVPRVLHFAAVDGVAQDPNDWVLRGSHDTTALEEILFSFEGVSVIDAFPEALARILSGSHGRGKDVRTVAGQLNHPVHGRHPNWIYNFDEPLPPAREGSPHLQRLFGEFDLSPESHAALYTFLLGVCHEVSLREDRPILLVDSWRQGRGKSQLCRAISELLDGEDRALSLQHSSDGARDEVVAHYLTGRTGYIDNIDAARGWNHPLIASMATGAPSARPKHHTHTVPLRGCVVMLNCIYGAASFHGDLIDRVHRVELPGHPSPEGFRNPPAAYARQNRLAILSEILAAHAAGEDVQVSARSRFPEFERAAVPAYCAAFGVSVEEALRRLEGARRGARGLATEVMEHLYCNHSRSFLSAHERVFRGPVWSSPSPGLAPRLPADAAGARGLGMVLGKDLQWTS